MKIQVLETAQSKCNALWNPRMNAQQKSRESISPCTVHGEELSVRSVRVPEGVRFPQG